MRTITSGNVDLGRIVSTVDVRLAVVEPGPALDDLNEDADCRTMRLIPPSPAGRNNVR